MNSADTQRAQQHAQKIPYAFARTHGVLPAGEDGDAVNVLMRDDATGEGLAELRRVLQRPLVTRVVDAAEFSAALARAYNSGAAASAISDDLSRDGDLSRLLQDLPTSEDLLDSSDAQAPVIRVVNALLLQALRERASDLHFEPYEARAVVRFRVDGVLRDVFEPPRA
ncbi:MAG: ATPase, T2SS/T4P/T4SS family, partial [Casimicrobiaceae bacterium]